MLKIITAPNPVLSQIAKPVEKFDKALHKLIEEMKVTLEHTTDPEGVGLAAPQIGKSIQLFIVKPTEKSSASVFINPKMLEDTSIILPHTKKDEDEEEKVKLEGCLSLPQIWGYVERLPQITLTYQDETGEKKIKKFTGFFATILQHEFDHLQGVLFPKRVLEQQGTLYKSKKNKKGEDIFEEIEL